MVTKRAGEQRRISRASVLEARACSRPLSKPEGAMLGRAISPRHPPLLAPEQGSLGPADWPGQGKVWRAQRSVASHYDFPRRIFGQEEWGLRLPEEPLALKIATLPLDLVSRDGSRASMQSRARSGLTFPAGAPGLPK